MICLRCNHYARPDREMERAQGSTDCACGCHPWNHDYPREGAGPRAHDGRRPGVQDRPAYATRTEIARPVNGQRNEAPNTDSGEVRTSSGPSVGGPADFPDRKHPSGGGRADALCPPHSGVHSMARKEPVMTPCGDPAGAPHEGSRPEELRARPLASHIGRGARLRASYRRAEDQPRPLLFIGGA